MQSLLCGTPYRTVLRTMMIVLSFCSTPHIQRFCSTTFYKTRLQRPLLQKYMICPSPEIKKNRISHCVTIYIFLVWKVEARVYRNNILCLNQDTIKHFPSADVLIFKNVLRFTNVIILRNIPVRPYIHIAVTDWTTVQFSSVMEMWMLLKVHKHDK